MAWFCIEVLLDAIRHARAAPAKATLPYSEKAQSPSSDSQEVPSEHLYRLYRTLVATVPSVSLTLLPRLLTEVKGVVISLSVPPVSLTQPQPQPQTQPYDALATRIGEMRAELVEALFQAISRDVGDAEKDYVITWWYGHREEVVRAALPARHPVFEGVETSAESNASDVVSRL